MIACVSIVAYYLDFPSLAFCCTDTRRAARAARLPEMSMSALERICFSDVFEAGVDARAYYVQMRNEIVRTCFAADNCLNVA